MILRKKHPSPWYNMHDVSRGSMPTDEFLYRLELSYQGHPTTFIYNICWKSKYWLKFSKSWERLACSDIL